jgi:hypothetical protein
MKGLMGRSAVPQSQGVISRQMIENQSPDAAGKQDWSR